jgi:hypothetical protein
MTPRGVFRSAWEDVFTDAVLRRLVMVPTVACSVLTAKRTSILNPDLSTGLRNRGWRSVANVTFIPPTNRTRMLLTVRPEKGACTCWRRRYAFEQFFAEISAHEARCQLGPAEEDRFLNETATREFIAKLDRLIHRTPV